MEWKVSIEIDWLVEKELIWLYSNPIKFSETATRIGTFMQHNWMKIFVETTKKEFDKKIIYDKHRIESLNNIHSNSNITRREK